MAWTKPQKMLAGRAFREAGVEESARQLWLRQLGGRAGSGERLSTTAATLTNDDFERYMAWLESEAPGPLVGKGMGYWSRALAEGKWGRCRWKAQQEADRCAARDGEPYTRGVIGKAARTSSEVELDNLDTQELRRVIDALSKVNEREEAARCER